MVKIPKHADCCARFKAFLIHSLIISHSTNRRKELKMVSIYLNYFLLFSVAEITAQFCETSTHEILRKLDKVKPLKLPDMN